MKTIAIQLLTHSFTSIGDREPGESFGSHTCDEDIPFKDDVEQSHLHKSWLAALLTVKPLYDTASDATAALLTLLNQERQRGLKQAQQARMLLVIGLIMLREPLFEFPTFCYDQK